MSTKTQARPYAQAIFEHSDGWLDDLQQVVTAIREPGVTMLIDSPKLAYKEKAEIFIGLFEGEIEKRTSNFLKILGEAKRLSLLPDILSEYKKLEANKNNLKEVQINSAYEMSQGQQEEIESLLKKRYGENISVTTEEDASLTVSYTHLTLPTKA